MTLKRGLELKSALLALIFILNYQYLTAQVDTRTVFGKTAWKESAESIRPGVPGKAPFWNTHARRFIYAPAFDYKLVSDAVKYEYELTSLADSSVYKFESNVPYSSLSSIWASVPVGFFQLRVTGISAAGKQLGVAGQGRYYRAAPFNGPYHKPVMPYDKSAMIALDSLFAKDYVNYWLVNKAPDPEYVNYRYPAKIWSALIIGAVTYAKLKPGTEEARRSISLAEIIADNLIKIGYEKGSVWEYFPPTYHGSRIGKDPQSHMQLENNFTIMGTDAGNAYLDLYDYTGEKKYMEAAKRIADTYVKNQMKNGSWHQFVNYKTGEPVAPNIVIPTIVINYFDRLRKDYKVKGLEKPAEAALKWVMENPVKTFNWQGQFEDVKARPPYQNLSREQACNLAVYLFKNKEKYDLAEELLRFAEDQFVIWEKPIPMKVGKSKNPGHQSQNWITPSVQEQYVYWMPVGRSAGIMVDAYRDAYQATGKEIYLAKAKSIANSFTLVQKAHNGNYPTYFSKYTMDLWLNSTVYPAKVLMEFQKYLKNN